MMGRQVRSREDIQQETTKTVSIRIANFTIERHFAKFGSLQLNADDSERSLPRRETLEFFMGEMLAVAAAVVGWDWGD